jgi:hypothetical protein
MLVDDIWLMFTIIINKKSNRSNKESIIDKIKKKRVIEEGVERDTIKIIEK